MSSERTGPPTPPPDGLQLDLLTAVARLRQLQDVEYYERGDHWLMHRILNCDLPRLEGHLTPETIAWQKTYEDIWQVPPGPDK